MFQKTISFFIVKFTLDDYAYTDFYAAKIVLNGPAGHTVIFKYNNAKEQKITLDGTDQEVLVEFVVPLDLSKALYFFFDGGKTLTEEMTVTFYTIELFFN